MATTDAEILVTLSTFGEYSETPVKLLEACGFSYATNPYGRRMAPGEVVQVGRRSLGLIAGVEPYTDETLAQLPRLRCISRCGSGVDNIDLAAAARRGIAVVQTSEEPVVAVAEMTLAMMLALLRRLPRVDALTRGRRWQRVPGQTLAGKTVGVIGLGRIGRRVSELVQAFGAAVIGADPNADRTWAGSRGVELVPLAELLARSDIVSIHATGVGAYPLRLGAAEFAQMKPGAWLINMARGEMVDDLALAGALASGHLSGAGLDVFPQEPYQGPLCDSDRVILSPHQATLTRETRTAMEIRAVENLLGVLQHSG